MFPTCSQLREQLISRCFNAPKSPVPSGDKNLGLPEQVKMVEMRRCFECGKGQVCETGPSRPASRARDGRTWQPSRRGTGEGEGSGRSAALTSRPQNLEPPHARQDCPTATYRLSKQIRASSERPRELCIGRRVEESGGIAICCREPRAPQAWSRRQLL